MQPSVITIRSSSFSRIDHDKAKLSIEGIALDSENDMIDVSKLEMLINGQVFGVLNREPNGVARFEGIVALSEGEDSVLIQLREPLSGVVSKTKMLIERAIDVPSPEESKPINPFETIIARISENGLLLGEESMRRYRGNKEVVLAAVKSDPFAYKYASTELRGDEDVIQAAITGDIEVVDLFERDIVTREGVAVELMKYPRKMVQVLKKFLFASKLSRDDRDWWDIGSIQRSLGGGQLDLAIVGSFITAIAPDFEIFIKLQHENETFCKKEGHARRKAALLENPELIRYPEYKDFQGEKDAVIQILKKKPALYGDIGSLRCDPDIVAVMLSLDEKNVYTLDGEAASLKIVHDFLMSHPKIIVDIIKKKTGESPSLDQLRMVVYNDVKLLIVAAQEDDSVFLLFDIQLLGDKRLEHLLISKPTILHQVIDKLLGNTQNIRVDTFAALRRLRTSVKKPIMIAWATKLDSKDLVAAFVQAAILGDVEIVDFMCHLPDFTIEDVPQDMLDKMLIDVRFEKQVYFLRRAPGFRPSRFVSDLKKALTEKNTYIMNLLLSIGVPLSTLDESQLAELVIQSSGMNYQRVLSSSNFNPNVRYQGVPLLLYAMRNNKSELVEDLLKHDRINLDEKTRLLLCPFDIFGTENGFEVTMGIIINLCAIPFRLPRKSIYEIGTRFYIGEKRDVRYKQLFLEWKQKQDAGISSNS